MDVQQKVEAFFSGYPLHTYEKRHMLVHAQDEIPVVFYLESGRVIQYDIAASGLEVVVNTFKQGAFFPMSTALNNTPNTYFFETATVCRMRQAPKQAAVDFLMQNPDVMLDLLTRVYRGTDGILRRMAHLMGGDAHTRLLFEILNSVYRFGEQAADGSVSIPMNESELGKASGLARETINRELRRLKDDNLVTVANNGIVIKDVNALSAMLGARV